VPSPFPGMDPYIESWIWGDFHSRLISSICESLNPVLPKRYIATTDLYVWRVDPSETERTMVGGPDVLLAENRPAAAGTAAATMAAPVTTVLPGVTRKQRFLKVIDQLGRRVVTVVEVLSPSNKRAGDDGEAYRYKRDEYMASGVNLVEIDLLRSGVRPPLGDPAPPVSDYYLMVHRASERSRLGIWPFSVREPVPPVPIPLDPDVPDVALNLRSCIDHVYDLGRFGEQLDYSGPPVPPLREPDATWARDLLAARKRSGG
jgi:Protein of unknown function (DUF4058)